MARPRPNPLRSLPLALVAALLAQPAMAADLRVRVQDDDGRPLAEAAVCAGTPVDASQFGAGYTGRDGQAGFEQLPVTELVVVVSKPGFRGESVRLSGVRFDRLLIVTLARGGLGPACDPGRPPSSATPPAAIQVRDLRVEGISGTTYPPTVTLGYALAGEANEYRVSESRTFEGAAWRPLEPQPSVQLSDGEGRKTLYFQVRRRSEVGEGALSIESDVASVDLELGQGR